MYLHIIGRNVAKERGIKTYFTGEPCKHGHISERHTIDTKCIDCKREKDKRYYSRNKDAIIDKVNSWSKEYPEKRKEYYEKWKNKDRERYLVIARNSQHRVRAKRRGTEVNFSPEISEWVLRQEKICRYCGARCSEKYEIDHFYPICSGGKHEIENLVICCPSCNRSKHSKDPFVYLKGIRNEKK